MPWHQPFATPQGLHFYTGRVAGFPVPSEQKTTFPLITDQGRFRVSLPVTMGPPPMGASVILVGRMLAPDAPLNPGQVDPARILKAQGALAFLKGESWILLESPSAVNASIGKLRDILNRSLEAHVPDPARGLVAAALLNVTTDVSPATREAFLRSGMQHILAISGQHIGLLFAFLLLGSACLRLPRKWAFLVAGLVAAVYIPTVGSPLSVVRSGYMMACLLPCILLERPSSGLHAFCLTLAVDLLIHPHFIMNLGFQLSYAATLALILCSKPAGAFAASCGIQNTLLRAGIQMLFLSVLVTLFTYPVLAASTHALSPWGIFGNLATVPIGAAMLISGLCVWTFGPLPWLADAAGTCSALFSILLEGCVHFLARLPGALASIADPSTAWIGVLGLGALGSAAVFRLAGLRPGLFFTAILISLEIIRPWILAPRPGESRMTFLAVGHGDAAVLEFPGAVILIDAGPDPETARRVVVPFLRIRGINRIDALVLTHPDLDHYGGLPVLMETLIINRVIAPATDSGDSPIWDCLRTSCLRNGVAWVEAGVGDILYRSGSAELRVLGPGESLKDAEDNDRSLVCLLTTPKEKILFTGDIEGAGQIALAESWPLWKGAWLKAPHHGSDRTTLPCFLESVQAPVASISSGRRPGFPGLQSMATLGQTGTQTGVTSRDGALFWEFSPTDKGRAISFRSRPM